MSFSRGGRPGVSADGGGRPPRPLEWLCAATLPYRQREVVLGDLSEEYAERATRSGPGAANRWYAREVLRSLGPTLRRLPARLLAPRSFGTEDLATMVWFALVAVIVAACLAAMRLH